MAVQLSGSGQAEPVTRPRRRRGRSDNGDHTAGCTSEVRPTNATLIARCIDGEFGAWNELVTRYERLVYAIPLREGLSADDAAEISQAAFETLIQSLSRIREPDRLGHWLMTVTRRLTWRRRELQQVEVSLDNSLVDPLAESDDAQWERTADIYDAILELGDPCRSLIFGLFFDPSEPSYDQLVRLLGMAVGSIGPLRGRCLARLRTLIEEDAA